MARPREFDTDAAVDQALQVFWTQGFEATSIEDLVAATGVRRASLYNAFGSKAGLFGHALARYAEGGCAQLDAALACEGPFVDRIARYLADVLAAPDGRGCFIGNSVCELAGVQPDLHHDAVERADSMRRRIADAAGVARATGDLAPHVDPDVLATTVMAVLHGLQVMSKAGVSRQDLHAVIETTVAPFRDATPPRRP